jgi:integrase
MAKPRVLTEPFIRALKPAPAGQRYAVADALVPGLKVRVTDKGAKSFILWRRYGGARNPAARALGAVGPLTLAAAREKARRWLELVKAGQDPRAVELAQRAAEDDRKATTFGAVMEDYLARHVQGQRRAKVTTREIRKELLPRWRAKQVTEITRRDVTHLVDTIKGRGAARQAHNILGHVTTFFNWAIERGVYGLEASPCDRLRPARLIGPKVVRQRVLTDTELRAFWRATGRMGYPTGPLMRMLLLTGQRKSEVAEARWREFDLANRVWTVPPERFKSGASHTVPLSDDVVALLAGLPRWAGGDFLFSTTGGKTPVSGFSKAKVRLDRRMLRTLRAMARSRGDDYNAGLLQPFVIHDLRRTVRTRLASLRVVDAVAEMVIGHGRRGLQRVYDQHAYLDEMREALEAWAKKLRSIVAAQPTNIVALREAV